MGDSALSGVCACAVAYGWLEAGVALVVEGRGGSLVGTVGEATTREPLRPCVLGLGFVLVRLRPGKAGSGEVERLELPPGVGSFARGSVGRW